MQFFAGTILNRKFVRENIPFINTDITQFLNKKKPKKIVKKQKTQ